MKAERTGMLGTLLIRKERIPVGNRLHTDVELGDSSCSRSLSAVSFKIFLFQCRGTSRTASKLVEDC